MLHGAEWPGLSTPSCPPSQASAQAEIFSNRSRGCKTNTRKFLLDHYPMNLIKLAVMTKGHICRDILALILFILMGVGC